MANQRVWLVIPAAGVGRRMKSDIPKQYLKINNKPVIEHTLERLLGLCAGETAIAGIVVSISASDTFWPELALSSHPAIQQVNGGAERVDSVFSGLEYLNSIADKDDWVLVHDVARPCVCIEDIQKLFMQLKDHPVGGVLAVPASDTLKQVNDSENCDDTIECTIDRSKIWAAQTPQMFRFGILFDALRQAKTGGAVTTDEAHAVELRGHEACVVEGQRNNIKITCPEDLAIATAILDYQQSQQTGSKI